MDQYPLFYRIMFLWLEPVSMGGGAIQAALDPAKLIELSLPGVHYSADMRPLMLGFSGSWLLMFYQRIVTLRRFTSRRAWTDVLIAHSISDLIYLAAYIYCIGWARFLNPALWTLGDWVTNPLTTLPFLVKLAFIAGIGLDSSRGAVELPSDGDAARPAT